jgi:hypothetical protein
MNASIARRFSVICIAVLFSSSWLSSISLAVKDQCKSTVEMVGASHIGLWSCPQGDNESLPANTYIEFVLRNYQGEWDPDECAGWDEDNCWIQAEEQGSYKIRTDVEIDGCHYRLVDRTVTVLPEDVNYYEAFTGWYANFVIKQDSDTTCVDNLKVILDIAVTNVDITLDGSVDTVDHGVYGLAHGSNESSPNWDRRCDFNDDGSVDTIDYGIFGEHIYHHN